MKLHVINISGNIYHCTCEYSPDDNGYYIEMYHKESGNWYHANGIHETEQDAWEHLEKYQKFHIV